MFGYITPAISALSDEDKALWQSFYCTLCRQIGEISQTARLGLSYDLTFLAILIAAISDIEPTVSGMRRCILHPFKKTAEYAPSEAFSYAAGASVILIKHKLDDDRRDDKNILCGILANMIKDDRVALYDLDNEILTSLARLDEVEKQNLIDLDRSADCFAVLCARLFSLSPAPESQKKPLYWLGYNLGRFIYLLDAWEDLKSDIKKGSYNPFADGRAVDEILNDAPRVQDMLTFTLSEAAAAYDLLDVKRFSAILENVIYAGLPARLELIMKGKNAV